MLSSESTCKDCLNERAATFTYGCREAVMTSGRMVCSVRTHCTSAGLFVATKAHCAGASAVDGGQTGRERRQRRVHVV